MINKVTLLGHVGQDPETRDAGGTKVSSFSLATTETFMKDNVKKELTEWHRIEIWGKLANIVATYIRKGSKIYLEGKIKTENYMKDEKRIYVTKVVCNTLKMLDNKQSTAATPTPAIENSPEPGEDGLPF